LFTDLLELDFKKELELEKKRQQIERELKQLGAYEERENITIEKKVSYKPQILKIRDLAKLTTVS